MSKLVVDVDVKSPRKRKPSVAKKLEGRTKVSPEQLKAEASARLKKAEIAKKARELQLCSRLDEDKARIDRVRQRKKSMTEEELVQHMQVLRAKEIKAAETQKKMELDTEESRRKANKKRKDALKKRQLLAAEEALKIKAKAAAVEKNKCALEWEAAKKAIEKAAHAEKVRLNAKQRQKEKQQHKYM